MAGLDDFVNGESAEGVLVAHAAGEGEDAAKFSAAFAAGNFYWWRPRTRWSGTISPSSARSPSRWGRWSIARANRPPHPPRVPGT
jgi:hypothetical protein